VSLRQSGAHATALLAVAVAVFAVGGLYAQDRRHTIGQTVTPSFEGWFKDKDGSFGLVFGYFNRNFEATIDIPVGPDNMLEPGPADQGQPTHFLTRRQVGVFTIKVPADFRNKTVTWTLVNGGQKLTIPGYIRPEWEITPFEEPTNGGTPPKIRFGAAVAASEGPMGLTASPLKARVNQPVSLRACIEPGHAGEDDDPASSRGTAVEWSVYRGGSARFAAPRTRVDKAGEVTTTATFDRPGHYRLRLLAGHAQTRGCCWTNSYFDVVVE